MSRLHSIEEQVMFVAKVINNFKKIESKSPGDFVLYVSEDPGILFKTKLGPDSASLALYIMKGIKKGSINYGPMIDLDIDEAFTIMTTQYTTLTAHGLDINVHPLKNTYNEYHDFSTIIILDSILELLDEKYPGFIYGG